MLWSDCADGTDVRLISSKEDGIDSPSEVAEVIVETDQFQVSQFPGTSRINKNLIFRYFISDYSHRRHRGNKKRQADLLQEQGEIEEAESASLNHIENTNRRGTYSKIEDVGRRHSMSKKKTGVCHQQIG